MNIKSYASRRPISDGIRKKKGRNEMFNFQGLSKFVQQEKRSIYKRVDDQLIASVASVARLIKWEMNKMEKKGFLDSEKYREAKEVLCKLENIKKEILELKESLEGKPWTKEEIDFNDT